MKIYVCLAEVFDLYFVVNEKPTEIFQSYNS